MLLNPERRRSARAHDRGRLGQPKEEAVEAEAVAGDGRGPPRFGDPCAEGAFAFTVVELAVGVADKGVGGERPQPEQIVGPAPPQVGVVEPYRGEVPGASRQGATVDVDQHDRFVLQRQGAHARIVRRQRNNISVVADVARQGREGTARFAEMEAPVGFAAAEIEHSAKMVTVADLRKRIDGENMAQRFGRTHNCRRL